MDLNTEAGRVVGVNGPVVRLDGLSSARRFEYVEVGQDHLPGEIITIEPDIVVAQIYEHTGGLAVGDPAWARGEPLSIELGPGLLGGIYDGLLRPLADGADFLPPRGLDRPAAARHHFEPAANVGDLLAEGDVLGSVPTTGPTHLVLVPPGVAGRCENLVTAGPRDPDDVIATVGLTPITLRSRWPVRQRRPYRQRRTDREPFVTGQRVLDILEPIAKGSSATVIGGFGEGKTMLLEQLAKWGDADVIIYVGCGERGNELADLIEEFRQLSDPQTGRGLLERIIVLANTSNMPVMAREASIYTAVTLAEYFRDMGHHAVIIADSTSRWAEAQRELAGRTGAIPAEQGYPASLPDALAAFYQRAGRVITTGGRIGTVTIVTSVSPAGGDTTEPVAAHTQRFVQAVWGLDRQLAYARHYPAVSWRASFSRDAEAVARWHTTSGDPDWAARRARLQTLLAEADRIEGIADLVGLSALPTSERVTMLTGRLIREAVLQQSALSVNDATSSLAKQAALAEAVLQTHDTAAALATAGVPATLIEGFDYGPLLRAKDTVGPADADGIKQIATALVDAMKVLRP